TTSKPAGGHRGAAIGRRWQGPKWGVNSNPGAGSEIFKIFS
ncbi:hypothetical protein HMPREF1548_00115, partial [Clostridium sp. KLE 1755]